MVAHVRTHITFYFLMMGVINTLALLNVRKDIPWWLLSLMMIVQLCAIFQSTGYAMRKGNQYFGFPLAVFHVIVLVVAFDGLLLAIM